MIRPQNLYATSELAQHLIKIFAKAHGWTLESYPGKVRLPPDILRPLPNAEAANEVRCPSSITRVRSLIGWSVDHEDDVPPCEHPRVAC